MTNDIVPDRNQSDEYGRGAWEARDIEHDDPIIHYCQHRRTEPHEYMAGSVGGGNSGFPLKYITGWCNGPGK